MADLAGQTGCPEEFVHFQWNLRMIWNDLPRSLVWFGRKYCWTIFLNLKKQLPSGIQISHLVCQICIITIYWGINTHEPTILGCLISRVFLASHQSQVYHQVLWSCLQQQVFPGGPTGESGGWENSPFAVAENTHCFWQIDVFFGCLGAQRW